ncbi:hypothetical protein RclHR1_12560005 [Rhizophagus clarus]|uniref:Uncharacterized protein n=1 Tax=Rhizophagus clarus TaxID=94130 RepID=A0A2Z6Q975_9GLOM|nr:hypothetical protein RclHR1_12560005 [Rhizophagus clarus]
MNREFSYLFTWGSPPLYSKLVLRLAILKLRSSQPFTTYRKKVRSKQLVNCDCNREVIPTFSFLLSQQYHILHKVYLSNTLSLISPNGTKFKCSQRSHRKRGFGVIKTPEYPSG